MEPELLEENKKAYWKTEEIFRGGMDWVHTFIERDYAIGMHAHEFYEINLVIASSGRHYIGNRSYPAQLGDAFVIPPDIRHGYRGEKGFHVHHMLIHPHLLERYWTDLQILPCFHILFQVEPLMRVQGSAPLYLHFSSEQLKEIEALLWQLDRQTPIRDAVEAVSSRGLALMCIARLCAAYRRNREQQDNSGGNDAAFMKSLALIYEQYGQKLTVEQLAKTAMRSRTAYLADFKQRMGCTPGRFLRERRLEAAQTLLQSTSLPVAEIAARTGFCDASHLIRSFTKAEGCSPLTFRMNVSGCRDETAPTS